MSDTLQDSSLHHVGSPLVSIIIRTHNRPDLLQQALQSAVAQKHRPLEMVIVNDGGLDVAGQLPANEDHAGLSVQYLNLQPGVGRSAAANAGLEAAKGSFLMLLDDDDWLDSSHVSMLLDSLAKHPQAMAAYSNVQTVSDQPGHQPQFFNADFDPERLLFENFIPIHAVLFRQQAVQSGCRFDPDFERLEDWDFWLQVAQLGPFIHEDHCSAYYRVTTGSGFGIKSEASEDQYRLAIYQKWRHKWTQAQLLAMADRGRQYPRIGHLQADLELKLEALKNREIQLQQRELDIVELSNQNLQRHYQIVALDEEVKRYTLEAINLQNQIDSLQRDISMIYASRSWRLTKPLRHLSTALMIWRNEGTLPLLARIWRKLFAPRSSVPGLSTASRIANQWQPLIFQSHETPLVSIVIPVYNKHLYTFHCLASVLANTDEVSYEVIVVDDQSQDETASMLAKMQGIRVITNQSNQGFIHSCNAGASAARGEYLVLLNNDTEPKPGWLRSLLQTFRDFPHAGLVGAKLVYPNGVLQEAGGIVWQDASAWNYGRNQDPNQPEYSYCRQVDYCSGACLMIATDDFRKLGMFDAYYAPAYYEDTDLAFRVRAAGKQVYYQSGATVIHFEGITSGTDTNTGIKRYQTINHQKFQERWTKTLEHHRPNAMFPHLEKERNVQKRALVVDARILMPDNDSGSLRMFRLVRILQKMGYKVTFVPDNLQYHPRYTQDMQVLGIECLYYPYVKDLAGYLHHHGHLFDVVLLSRVDVAERHIAAVRERCGRAKILFDTVDLHFLREQRQAELSSDRLMLEAALVRKHQELNIARQADVTLVVSPVEIEVFQQEAPDIRLALLSNVHDTKATSRVFSERRDILFIGSFEHPPNVDAMLWFIKEVLPLLHSHQPDIRLRVIGANPPKTITSLANDRVLIDGFISDIEPIFNDIRLSVAPLRYGAGVKGKINSSMAYGVPVVATTIAAEGMDLVDGEDVLIADSPEAFAAAIMRIYKDEQLWSRLVDGGKRNIERCFSSAVAERQLTEILSG
jgi:O-antigen biosynthesis protein